MELKLFTDLIEAIVNLPKAERETIRRTLYETYHLIEAALAKVVIRLSDSLIETSNDDLLCKYIRLTHLAEESTR